MGIVKGFTDIIAPQNLATNGSFRINQRGLYSTLQQATPFDYLSDCWYLDNSTNVDFLQVRNDTSYAYILFQGYGKKNQVIYIKNPDRAAFGIYPQITSAGNGTPFTASVSAKLSSGVPVKLRVYARHTTTAVQNIYDYQPTLTLANSHQTAVNVRKTYSYVPYDFRDTIEVRLMADGEFNVMVYGFNLLSGEFVNPPLHTPIPLADDLLRCKRYYQAGSAFSWSLGRNSGINFIASAMVQLVPEMAGTPTVVMSGATVTEVGSTVDVASNYITLSPASVHSKGFLGTFYKTPTGALPNSFGFDWTATV